MEFQPFALAKLNTAHISFDAFIDNQSEFDFVCENSELYDIRSEGKKNFFLNVLIDCGKNLLFFCYFRS